MELEHDYEPTPKQMEVHKSKARFRVINSGRRVGKCRDAESLVQIADGGLVKAKDLIGRHFNILSFNGSGDFKECEATAESNGIKPVYRVTTKTGRFVEGTNNHPLLTLWGWKNIDKLKVGDKIAATKIMAVYGQEEINLDEVKLLAYMIGDGGLTQGTPRFSQENNKQLTEWKEIVHKLGGEYRHICDISYSVTKLNDFFRKYGIFGKYSWNKEIPQEIFKLTDDQIASFLSRLYSTDGWYSKGEVGYCSTSKILVHQIQYLLLRFGIKSILSAKKANKLTKHTAYQLVIKAKDDVNIFGGRIGIYGKMPRGRVHKKKGSEKKSQILRYNHNNWFYDTVVAIDYLGERETVAISVPETETYAGLFVEHNSTLAITEILKKAIEKKGVYWIVAPTYRQVKSIYWRTLVLQYIPKELIEKSNESELTIHLKGGSRVELKGADSPDSLRGARIDGVVMDEYAYTKPYVWEEIIEPIVRESNGWALFTSTPRGFNHFYDLCEYAKDAEEWEFFHFTSYDNPYFDRKELEKVKNTVSPEVFGQEYMADFTRNSGLVYSEFDPAVHVLKSFSQPDPDWVKFRSIDFGQANPTAVLWIGVDKKGNIYIYDEIYEKNVYTSQLAHLIHAKSPDYYVATYGDSAAAQSIKDMSEHGIYINPVKKTTGASREDYVKAGIEKVREYLKIQEGTGKPRLFVAPGCQNTIDEFLSYSWKPPKATESQEDKKDERPDKANDHAMDALRYFIYEYTRPVKTKAKPYKPDDETSGY